MSDIFIEQPPQSIEAELKEYLARTLNNISGALQQNQHNTVIYVHPIKFKVGKLYYYGAAIALDPVVDAEGLYIYKSTGLVKVV